MKFALIALLAVLAFVQAAASKIHQNVHRALKSQNSVDIIVRMNKETLPIIEGKNMGLFSTSSEGIASLVDELEDLAKTSQSAVMDLVASQSSISSTMKATSLWSINGVAIQGATSELVQQLGQMNDVKSIVEDGLIYLDEPEPIKPSFLKQTLANEWGIEKIDAPRVWSEFTSGEGIVVGAIDTGVRVTHETLNGNYLDNGYSWYDPYTGSSAPLDQNGHGTHTMGTIAGSSGIGVAPGAKWMACRGCDQSTCTDSALLACGQFIACPTDTSGNNKDCSKKPDLVSNSWGGRRGDTFYREIVTLWRQADIIPIFAMGNSGSSCNTANSPGDFLDVIAVGATDSNDALASFSSRGTGGFGDKIKPDLSAPGVSVRSAIQTGDSAYGSFSGTSMACPHVAGAVALLMSHKNGITYDEIFNSLIGTVDTSSLTPPNQDCGGVNDASYPNHMYGYGRLNAYSLLTGDAGTPAPGPAPTSPPTDPCASLSWLQCLFSSSCTWSNGQCSAI